MNETKPVQMHPLGEILARRARLARPALTSSAPIELQQLLAEWCSYLTKTRILPVSSTLLTREARHIRELVTGQSIQPSAGGLSCTPGFRREALALTISLTRGKGTARTFAWSTKFSWIKLRIYDASESAT